MCPFFLTLFSAHLSFKNCIQLLATSAIKIQSISITPKSSLCLFAGIVLPRLWPQMTADLPSVTIVLPFECFINVIMWYVALYAWLHSFCIMCVRFIHVVAFGLFLFIAE